VNHALVPRPAGRPERPHLQKWFDAVCSAEAPHRRGSVRLQDLADRRAPPRGVGSSRSSSQSGGRELAQAVRAARRLRTSWFGQHARFSRNNWLVELCSGCSAAKALGRLVLGATRGSRSEPRERGRRAEDAEQRAQVRGTEVVGASLPSLSPGRTANRHRAAPQIRLAASRQAHARQARGERLREGAGARRIARAWPHAPVRQRQARLVRARGRVAAASPIPSPASRARKPCAALPEAVPPRCPFPFDSVWRASLSEHCP
jgi:hypothetical protein